MSQRILDYCEGLKQECEQEFALHQRQYDELLEFAQRMSRDKKRLTEQNINLIERVRELESKYESDFFMQRFASWSQKDFRVREGA